MSQVTHNQQDELSKAVLANLKSRESDMIQMLEEFVLIESGSRDKAAVDQMGEAYQQVFENMGFTTEVIEEAECGSHLVCTIKGSGEGSALILSHLDTVWPVGTLEWWPFEVTEDRITGPGVGDMKGGIVQAIFAIKSLTELGQPLPGKLTIFFTGDEELGSVRGRPHIERLGKEHDAVFVTEPANLQGEIVSARGGIGAFLLKVTGRTAHTGADPRGGVSAVHELSHKVVELEKLIDRDRRLMVNVGLVEGGTARQVFAEHAEAWIDLRAPSEELAEELLQNVQKIVNTSYLEGTTATLEGVWTRTPAPRTEGNLALVNAAQEYAAALGFEANDRFSAGGSDGSFTSPLGVPTLDGLGPITGEPVSAREYIMTHSLAERAALMAMLLNGVATSEINFE